MAPSPPRFAPHGALGLSDRFTLIVPLDLGPLGLAPEMSLGSLRFVAKAEHHLTVFGFGLGKPLKAALADAPALRAVLDAALAETDFGVAFTGPAVHLRRDQPKPIDTVVALVDAPGIAAFYGAAAAAVRAEQPSAEALLALLAAPPPPHVTLYTSDPAGKDAIGLGAVAELHAAFARGATEDATGLRAYRLAAGVVGGLGATAAPPDGPPL